mgnify:CR=1 FL=1
MLRILLVDDERTEREGIRFLIDKFNLPLKVAEAPNGKKALEYIRENSQEKLRLADVADQVYVSQWHLSKLLNKHTGKTFSDILNGARMDKSKELLKDPALRICDVAEMVGFQDLAHFSRVFKKMEGMSANEYRNTH